MNPFTFTRLRLRIFLGLLAAMFLLPICTFLVVGMPIVGAVLGGVIFIVALYVVNVPSWVFRGPWFTYQESGADPQGFAGWAAVIGFWIAVTFLLSWPAHLKRDR